MEASAAVPSLACPLCQLPVPVAALEGHVRHELLYAPLSCRLCKATFVEFSDLHRHFLGPIPQHPPPLLFLERRDEKMELEVLRLLRTAGAGPPCAPSGSLVRCCHHGAVPPPFQPPAPPGGDARAQEAPSHPQQPPPLPRPPPSEAPAQPGPPPPAGPSFAGPAVPQGSALSQRSSVLVQGSARKAAPMGLATPAHHLAAKAAKAEPLDEPEESPEAAQPANAPVDPVEPAPKRVKTSRSTGKKMRGPKATPLGVGSRSQLEKRRRSLTPGRGNAEQSQPVAQPQPTPQRRLPSSQPTPQRDPEAAGPSGECQPPVAASVASRLFEKTPKRPGSVGAATPKRAKTTAPVPVDGPGREPMDADFEERFEDHWPLLRAEVERGLAGLGDGERAEGLRCQAGGDCAHNPARVGSQLRPVSLCQHIMGHETASAFHCLLQGDSGPCTWKGRYRFVRAHAKNHHPEQTQRWRLAGATAAERRELGRRLLALLATCFPRLAARAPTDAPTSAMGAPPPHPDASEAETRPPKVPADQQRLPPIARTPRRTTPGRKGAGVGDQQRSRSRSSVKAAGGASEEFTEACNDVLASAAAADRSDFPCHFQGCDRRQNFKAGPAREAVRAMKRHVFVHMNVKHRRCLACHRFFDEAHVHKRTCEGLATAGHEEVIESRLPEAKTVLQQCFPDSSDME